MAVVVTITLCVVLYLVILWKLTLNQRKVSNLPPLAVGALPIVGHTFLVLANKDRLYNVLLETIVGASMKQGLEAVKLMIGTWDIYVVLNPDDGYTLLNSYLVKDPLYGFFKPMFGDEGLISADVPTWKKHRKLLSRTFNQKVLDTYLVQFNDRSRVLAKSLAQKVGKGSFDQMPYIKRAFMQLICATIMGAHADEEEVKDIAERTNQEFTDCMAERIKKFWYHNDFIFNLSQLKRKQDAAAAAFHALSYGLIKNKKAQLFKPENNGMKREFIEQGDSGNEQAYPVKSSFKAFIDHLLDLSMEGALTDSEVRDEVDTFMCAGYDTTSHSLGFILLNVGSYPAVQQKIVEELDEVFGDLDRDVEKQDIAKLKYLDAVIKETIRLYPVVPAIGRTLDKEFKFAKYTLPAGSRCWLSLYHMGRHPVWGPDAEQFRPERWLDGSLPSNPNAFAVFGLGKRQCIGSKPVFCGGGVIMNSELSEGFHNEILSTARASKIEFEKALQPTLVGISYAMMSMKTTMVHMLRRYHVIGDVTKLVQSMEPVVRPVSGHHIRIEKRKNY